MQRALVAVDFSEASLAAVQVCASLGADALRLVHVVPEAEFPTLQRLLRSTGLSRPEETSRALEGRLAELAQGIPMETSWVVRSGSPVGATILDEAAAWGADTVVVGPRSRRFGSRAVLGSTTARVLHESQLDVLVARHPVRQVNQILVATDLHKPSQLAARAAAELAEKLQASLTCVFVAHPGIWGVEQAVDWPETEEGIDGEWLGRAEKEAIFRWLRDKLHEFNQEHLQGSAVERIESDLPLEGVLKAAASSQADLIVLGTHGKNVYERTTLGSTAERVSALADCSVLVVKDPRP